MCIAGFSALASLLAAQAQHSSEPPITLQIGSPVLSRTLKKIEEIFAQLNALTL